MSDINGPVDKQSALSAILIPEKVKAVENGLVYNCLDNSEPAEFYSKKYSLKFQYEKPELYREIKEDEQRKDGVFKEMDRILDDMEKHIDLEARVIEIAGGIYQNRSANAYKRFKFYFPLDISTSNMRRYAAKYEKESIIADASDLPFQDNSVDCIFTHTFLEHPLQPQKVLEEIIRVLKPRGVVVHNDAWFCRWWLRYGIVGLKKFENMSSREKMIALAAKVTEFPLFRFPPIIARRAFRELFLSTKKPLPLAYGKLNPNYDLYLGCDEDAVSSLDPLDIIRFYESRGFTSLRPMNLRDRIFHPSSHIMLQKGNI